MNILVCISHVPDTTSKINFTNNDTLFDTNGVQFVINPNDEFGLTRAIWFQEQQGANVTVVNVGGPETEPTLRKALPAKFSTTDWTYVLIPALVAILLGVFSVVGELDASSILEGDAFLPKLTLVVVGFLGVSAFVVPGISGSMLLLTIGFYEPVLNSLQRLIENIVNLPSLVPEIINFALLGLGAFVGFIVISLLMAMLFKKYKNQIHLAIYGFIVGSIAAIFYNYKIVPVYENLTLIMLLISFVTLVVGVVVSYALNQRYATR